MVMSVGNLYKAENSVAYIHVLSYPPNAPSCLHHDPTGGMPGSQQDRLLEHSCARNRAVLGRQTTLFHPIPQA